MSVTTLIRLPEESICLISRFLSPPDVLNFISIHPTFLPLCRSKQFWSYLNQVHYGKSSGDNSNVTTAYGADDWTEEKYQYLLKSYCNSLSNVRWYPIDTQTDSSSIYAEPSTREGHVSCIIGNYLVLTGGFTDDNDLYIKHLLRFDEGTSWTRIQLEPMGNQNSKNWVYGATLTSYSDTTAIMFGGFQSGGYSVETSQVAILHLEESRYTPLSNRTVQAPVLRAWWEVVECHVYNDDDCAMLSKGHDSNESFAQIAARAYHSATLIFDRYLLIVGGMQSAGSILNPILLDCYSWTWYIDGITSSSMKLPSDLTISSPSSPSGRHGCSMVADLESNRNRLLLFGGGSGHDLLRFGTDNTEVWELVLNRCECAEDVIPSLPWNWNILHHDQNMSEEDDNDSSSPLDSDVDNNDRMMVPNPNCLSAVERCNLGRCHGGYRVGRDMVLLAFGSTCPTTNSILCYDLKDDSFFRPRVHPSFIPRGRFTFASTFVESKGIIIFHGGYSTHPSTGALSDTLILDLAPAMKNDDRLWLPIDDGAITHSTTTESMTREKKERASELVSLLPLFSFFCSQLTGKSPEEQRVLSLQILSIMDETQRSGSMARLIQLFAAGQVLIGDNGALICHDLDPDGERLIRFLM